MAKKRKRSWLTGLIIGGAVFSVASLLANKKTRKKILPQVKKTAQKFNSVIQAILKK
jgi:gas vesicle protein